MLDLFSRVWHNLVTSFFDSVDKLNDSTLFLFIGDLKRDKDLIIQILYASHNEMIVFMTYLLIILKKLNTIDHSFTNTIHMCKELA